jgi:hypothetical protein
MAAQKWNIVVQVSINAFDVVCIAFVAFGTEPTFNYFYSFHKTIISQTTLFVCTSCSNKSRGTNARFEGYFATNCEAVKMGKIKNETNRRREGLSIC